MVILGERDKAFGQAWHVPNAEPQLSIRAVIERVAGVLGMDPKISVMRRPVFELVSLFHPILREFRELRRHIYQPYIVDHNKFAAAFGDISTPLSEALRRPRGAVHWLELQRPQPPGQELMERRPQPLSPPSRRVDLAIERELNEVSHRPLEFSVASRLDAAADDDRHSLRLSL